MSTTVFNSRKESLVRRVSSPPSRRGGRWCLVVLGVALLACALASLVGYSLVVNVIGVGTYVEEESSAAPGGRQVSSASTNADGFMQSLEAHAYLQAYGELDDSLTLSITPDEFVHQAEQADACYGAITSFALIRKAGERFTYALRRSKLPRSYPFQLTLQQDMQGNWVVTGFGQGQTLNPPQPAPCH